MARFFGVFGCRFKNHMKKLTYIYLAALIGLTSCSTSYETKKQLGSINKDWDLIIRASHIYPVYPLSQDVLPGDIYLVQDTIDDTQSWSQPGYLPLDHLVARLYPAGYLAFYTNAWPGITNSRPYEWLKDNSWSNAPVAGFPSYSFSVSQGGGTSVALPIQGIPVGLSLMEAKQASGFVTLADAHTYGIDEISLRKQVHDFVKTNQTSLRYIIPEGDTNQYFLQIVSRVYTVGQVSVSMFNDSAGGGSLWGGSPKDVSIPVLNPSSTNAAATTASNYSNMVNAVNSTVPAASNVTSILPGGSLKFSMVSSRSVSMTESFPKPVVIGYIGFNYKLNTSATNASVDIMKSVVTTNGAGVRVITNNLVATPEIKLGKPSTTDELLHKLGRN